MALFLSVLSLFSTGTFLAQQKDSKPKECSVGGDRAPSHSCDRRRKEKSGQPTPDGLAQAKKLYGYHCAMCHGNNGDGKGDLAEQMKLD